MQQLDVEEVLENQIWVGVVWREAFQVPFLSSTVPAWSDAAFKPVQWHGLPKSNTDKGWSIVCSPATDTEGWVYGTAFDHLREDRPGGRASRRANDRVRSRLWRRQLADQQLLSQAACLSNVPSETGDSSHEHSGMHGFVNQTAAAAGRAANVGKAAIGSALGGAVQAVQAVQTVQGAVKKASLSGMWNTFSNLLKDAAARHNTAMITPDITGWFFVVSSHGEELKKQQLSQLPHLLWFTAEPQLRSGMKPKGLGSNLAGVILPAGPALAAQAAQAETQEHFNKHVGECVQHDAGMESCDSSIPKLQKRGSRDSDSSTATSGSSRGTSNSSSKGNSHKRVGSSSSSSCSTDSVGYALPGQPFNGLMLRLGAGNSSSSNSTRLSSRGSQGNFTRQAALNKHAQGGSQQQATSNPSTDAQLQANPSAAAGADGSSSAAGGSGSGLQLHVADVTMLDRLLAGARYSHAAYGYVAAAGHMSSLSNAIKLLATLPLFDPITGVSLQANTQALISLAGFTAEDVLLTAWHNDTFRPCHYVAIDRNRKNLVLGVRGSLEVGDLETDVTAAPLAFEFQGVAGWVHEGLLAAAAYVVSNTVDALAEAADRHPGWPLVVAGHSLGGGVAALVTLLLQQPGAAPRGISSICCVCIGPAAVLSEELNVLCEQYITSVIVGADPIPRLSTYSVESLLLDLVNASISRRVTSQLAATTSSMAASTAGAINSLTQGLSRLANQATGSMNNMAGALAGTLAGSFNGLAQLTGGPGDILGLNDVAAGYLHRVSGGRSSIELAKVLDGSDAVGCSSSVVTASAGDLRQQLAARQGLKGILQPAESLGSPPPSKGIRQNATPSKGPPVLSSQHTSTAASGRDSSSIGFSVGSPVGSPVGGSSNSSSSSSAVKAPAKPGGPKLVQCQRTMIYPKVDEAQLISGIQEAWGELNKGGSPVSAACFDSHSSRSADGGTKSGCSQVAVGSAPDAAPSSPFAAIVDDTDDTFFSSSSLLQPSNGSHHHHADSSGSSSTRTVMSKCPSESSLQQWASDNLEPLGEPSWVRVSREASIARSEDGKAWGQGARGDGSYSSDPADNTVSALESDLKQTARLYPPGRILWVLSDDLVGPAANQLIAAVAAHLPHTAAAPAAAQPSTHASREQRSSKSKQLQAPTQEHMDVPASNSNKQTSAQQQHDVAQHTKQKSTAHDTATAHAVAAASAKHILHDVHGLDAKRTAAAALHAAQHDHPPLHLSGQQQQPDAGEEQLQQQQQHEEADIQAGRVCDGSHCLAAAGHQEWEQQPHHRPYNPDQGDSANHHHQQQQAHASTQAIPASVQLVSRVSRTKSMPLEVDGSAAADPSSCHTTANAEPQDLPPELHELLRILGPPTDAATALALAYKKQLLLEHFWKQRREDAAREQQQHHHLEQLVRCKRRASSDSVLLRYEDMVASVDASESPLGRSDSQVELMVQRSRAASSGSSGLHSCDQQTAIEQTAAAECVLQQPSQQLLQKSSSGSSNISRTHSHRRCKSHSCSGQSGRQQQQEQHLQLSMLSQSDDYVQWATEQPAMRKRQQDEQEWQQQQRGSSSDDAIDTSGHISLQELAIGSLIELAHLPERIAESFSALHLGSSGRNNSSSSNKQADNGCEGSGLAGLCSPLVAPVATVAGGGGGTAAVAAAAAAAATAAGGSSVSDDKNRLPVVVMPERDVFSKLLLYKSAVQDHLPSNYVRVLQELKEAYSRASAGALGICSSS